MLNLNISQIKKERKEALNKAVLAPAYEKVSQYFTNPKNYLDDTLTIAVSIPPSLARVFYEEVSATGLLCVLNTANNLATVTLIEDLPENSAEAVLQHLEEVSASAQKTVDEPKAEIKVTPNEPKPISSFNIADMYQLPTDTSMLCNTNPF